VLTLPPSYTQIHQPSSRQGILKGTMDCTQYLREPPHGRRSTRIFEEGGELVNICAQTTENNYSSHGES